MLIQGGKLKPLAIPSNERSTLAAGAATLSESGVPSSRAKMVAHSQ